MEECYFGKVVGFIFNATHLRYLSNMAKRIWLKNLLSLPTLKMALL